VLNLSSIVRYLWAAPTTAIGILIALAGFWRAKVHVVDGVLEAHGPTLAWILTNLTFLPGGAAALTLGHLVIGRDHESLESTRAHERVHVRQCEAWGPLFVPAYFAASLTAIARGRSAYSDNCFEVEAFGIERTPSASNQGRRRARGQVISIGRRRAGAQTETESDMASPALVASEEGRERGTS